MTKLDRRIVVVSLLFYGVALFLPGLAAHGENPYGFTGYSGFTCLAWGAATALGGLRYFIPWTANLFYLPALILWCIGPRARLLGAVLALGGLFLASFTFRIDSVVVNEAGHRAAVRPGLGAWTWMVSLLVLFAGAFVSAASAARRPRPPPP